MERAFLFEQQILELRECFRRILMRWIWICNQIFKERSFTYRVSMLALQHKSHFIVIIHDSLNHWLCRKFLSYICWSDEKKALHFIAYGREIEKIKEKTRGNNNNRFIFDIMTAKRILVRCLKGSMWLRCQIQAYTHCVCVYYCTINVTTNRLKYQYTLSICIKLRQIHRSYIHMTAYSISYARTKKKAIERERKSLFVINIQNHFIYLHHKMCVLELSLRAA